MAPVLSMGDEGGEAIDVSQLSCYLTVDSTITMNRVSLCSRGSASGAPAIRLFVFNLSDF